MLLFTLLVTFGALLGPGDVLAVTTRQLHGSLALLLSRIPPVLGLIPLTAVSIRLILDGTKCPAGPAILLGWQTLNGTNRHLGRQKRALRRLMTATPYLLWGSSGCTPPVVTALVALVLRTKSSPTALFYWAC